MLRRVRDEGQDLVEFALIAPLLFLLLFGILEFGVVIWRYNTVANAAREGARAAAVFYLPGGEAGREAKAVQAADDYAQRLGDIPITTTAHVYTMTVTGGELPAWVWMIGVTTTYTHTGITGLFSPQIRLQSQSHMVIEY